MLAVGASLTETLVVVEKSRQPPAATIVQETVYVPDVAPEGVSCPVEPFIDKPVEGNMLKTPPVVPINPTLIGGLGFVTVLSTLHKLLTGQDMVAVGACVIITVVVVENPGQGSVGEIV